MAQLNIAVAMNALVGLLAVILARWQAHSVQISEPEPQAADLLKTY
jgi:hypothetical protein